jgi:hypothetical protein
MNSELVNAVRFADEVDVPIVRVFPVSSSATRLLIPLAHAACESSTTSVSRLSSKGPRERRASLSRERPRLQPHRVRSRLAAY